MADRSNHLMERISVRAPYFDLDELKELGDGMLTAAVPCQAPTAPECGAVEAAQVARHLAILGSCAAAAARDDDDRHHYLATRAHYARLANAPETTTGPLRGEAVASWIDRRTARAVTTLRTEAGRGCHLLDCEYTVLTPKMFDRFHPAPESAPDDDVLHLCFDATPLDATAATAATVGGAGGVRVDCGPIPVGLCAGHFPGYPAAPVAIVMGQLCRAAGLALANHLGCRDVPYRIDEGHVAAHRLARAGQRLVLEAGYDTPIDACRHQLHGRALADGEVVGEVTVVLATPSSR